MSNLKFKVEANLKRKKSKNRAEFAKLRLVFLSNENSHFLKRIS